MRTPLVATGLALLLASAARAQGPQPDVPLIIVHGIDGSTAEPARLARKLARGRPLFPDIYRQMTALGFSYRGCIRQMLSAVDESVVQADSIFVRDGGAEE